MFLATAVKPTLTVADAPIAFAEVYVLTDPAAARQAMQLTDFFQHAIAPSGANRIALDLGRAIELVAASLDMALARKVDQSFVFDGEPVYATIDAVLRIVRSTLDVPLHQRDIDQLRTAVAGAFVGLAAQQDDPWLAFAPAPLGRCTWSYNLNVVVQSEETGDFAYVVPLGLTIESRLARSAALALKSDDVADFVVRVQAIKAIQFLRGADREVPSVAGLRTSRPRLHAAAGEAMLGVPA
jgi:hypothetical protein